MKKRISLLLAAVMLLGLVSGCSQPPAAQTDPVGQSDPPSAATPGDGAPDSIYAPYEGTELVFIRHSGYEADWMTEKAEEFYRLSGIRVTVEQVAYSELKNKILLDISSPSGAYDMIASTEYWLSEFNEGGWLADMYPLVNNPDLTDAAFDMGDIGQSTLDANTINGQLLAMPWKFNGQLLAYRSDLIDTPPATWEEYLEMAEQFTKDGMVGVSLALSPNSIMDVYLNLLYQAGGTFLGEDNKTCNLDSKEAKEALEFLLQLNQYTSSGATNNQWPESATLFGQGGAALYPTISSQISNLIDPEASTVHDSVGYAELPGGVGCLSTWGVAITANCKHPEAAWLFIQYMLSPEKTEELVIGTAGADIPVRSSLLLSDAFMKDYPHYAVMNAITQSEGHTWTYPKTTSTTAIMEALAVHVQNAILGTETVDQALGSAKAEIEALLGG